MNLIEMSIMGAILILFITVLRALIIHHLPKMTFIILWCICMLRLLIPVSFSSQFSLYTFLNSTIKIDEMRSINSVQVVGKQPTKIVKQTDILSKGTVDYIVDNIIENVTNNIGTIIWSVGVILIGCYFIIFYINYKKKFRISLPTNNTYVNQWKKELRTIRKIDIRVSDRIVAPLTYGIMRPIILLPKKMNWEDEQTLNYILTHEYIHIRRLDAVIKIILAVTLCIHWFNPLVWVMYILANRDIELSCDEIVVYKFGETKKTFYALTLIGMEETKTKSLSLYNHFSRNAIEERITAIMKTKRISKLTCGVAFVLIVSTIIVFSTSAIGADKQKSMEENKIKLETVNPTTKTIKEIGDSTEKSKSDKAMNEINGSNSENITNPILEKVEDNVDKSESDEAVYAEKESNVDNATKPILEKVGDSVDEGESDEDVYVMKESNVDNTTNPMSEEFSDSADESK